MKKNLFLLLALTLSKTAFSAASDPSEIKSLHDAVKKGHLEGIARLLNNDTINRQNKAEKTPLILAVENGHKEIVQLLLQHNAQTEVKDSYGMTALMHAAHNGELEITSDLIRHNAYVNAQDNEDWSPLMFSVLKNHISVCKLLITHNANPHLSNSDGDSSISLAGLDRKGEVLEILLTESPRYDIFDPSTTNAASFFNVYKREMPY